jgi:hypothetical protein
MSSISDSGRKTAQDGFGVRLLPSPDDKPQAITDSVAFGPFAEGDYVTILNAVECYMETGGSDVVATTSDHLLPIGDHDFAVPTGVTHVALISTVTGAKASVWKS